MAALVKLNMSKGLHSVAKVIAAPGRAFSVARADRAEVPSRAATREGPRH